MSNFGQHWPRVWEELLSGTYRPSAVRGVEIPKASGGVLLGIPTVMDRLIQQARGEGTPQVGPLSPLLSNILLNEFDWELKRRSHRFVRYADDCSLFLRSSHAWAMRYAWSRKGGWRLSCSPVMKMTVTEGRLKQRGYQSFKDYYHYVRQSEVVP